MKEISGESLMFDTIQTVYRDLSRFAVSHSLFVKRSPPILLASPLTSMKC
jgi:hypothetical protein